MSNSLYEEILKGHSVPLTETELQQFEIFCSAQNLSLQKLSDISLLLFQQKRQYALHFLQYVQRTEIFKPIYNDFIHQDNKVRILNYLFALMLAKATKQNSKPQMDAYAAEARKYLAQCVNVKGAQNVVSRAFLEYYDTELTKATNMFNNVIESNDTATTHENKLIAMLGLAQIYFLKRNYAKSLESYKLVLSTFKSLPIKARIGMGYCFFYLQKYQMARACFIRVLKLDPNCIEACIGLAVVQEKDQNFVQYFRNLSKAIKVNKKHPLVLIHLSEHFLIKGDLEKASKAAHDGLIQVQKMPKFLIKSNKTAEQLAGFRNDYIELKARFNNILGQVQHIKNNFLQALRFYRLACNPNLPFNEIYLSQTYTQCTNYVQSLQILQKLFKESGSSTLRFLNDSLKDFAYLKSKNPVPTTEQKSCEQAYNEAISYNKNDIEVKIELSNQIMETKKARALRLLLSVYKIVELESGTQTIRPELLNNIGVLYIENHEYKEAVQYLEPCTQRLKVIHEKLEAQRIARGLNNHINGNHSDQAAIKEEVPSTNQQEEGFETQCIKMASNYLIALFNFALVKEKLCLFSQAIEIYEEILKTNKYFIDAHIRMAYVYFCQGNFQKAMSVLQSAIKESQDKQTNFIRYDKVISMKLSILKMWGDQVSAKDGVKQISKNNRDVYTQIFELSLQYEQLLKRQPQLAVIKQFLRPNRQIYMRLCHDDPHNAFGYLVLCVLLLTDKRISLKQGSQLFAQLKQHASEDMPIILYNMGLFFLNYDDYDKAKFIFKLYKEKTNDQRADELFALISMLEGNYDKSIQSIKKSILLNPVNIKSRYQLFYSTEKKIEQQRQDQKSRLRSLISTHLQSLRKCHKFYNSFSRINANDYIKCYESPDMKELTRTFAQKIRSLCEERKFYVGSNIDYYEKLQKDQMIKAKEEEERERRLKMAQAISEEAKQNTQVIDNDAFKDWSDSEEIRKTKREEKKRKALDLARKKDQEINEKFEEIKEKEREQREKKIAKMSKQPREKGTRKRQKRPKAAQSQDQIQYESDKSFLDEPSRGQSPSGAELQQNDEQIEAPKRKRRQERREERREERRQRKKKIKKERLAKLEHQDDEQLSNPFSPAESKRSGDEGGESGEEKRQKKKKKKEEKPQEEEEDYGMDKYLI